MIFKVIRQNALLFLLLFALLVASAQNKSGTFHISGRIRVDNGDPTGSVVTLTNVGTKKMENSTTITATGKFEFDLTYFSEYMLTVVKDNHYPKDISVSTMIPSQVWEKDSIFPPFLMVITIYKKVPNVTLSFEGKTVGKICYSPKGKLDNFDSNIFIDDKEIRKEIEQAIKEHEDEIFNQKMAEAVEFEKKNQIREAIHAYEEALALRKNDPFIKPKLKELASDMKNIEKDALLEGEFNRLVAAGDENVTKLKYPEAVDNFKAALAVKPGNEIASAKLINAEQLLAKVNAEKAKLDEEFNRLLALGDVGIKEKKYQEAIENFKSALVVKPGKSVATEKLTGAERLLAQTNADIAKTEAEFSRLLAVGDEYVIKQKYTEGITTFKDALSIKPLNPTAMDKLAHAEQLYARVNADKLKLEAEFNRLLAAGDDQVTGKKYPEAIESFKGALLVKPGNSVATDRLAGAEKLLAKLNADKEKLDADFAALLAAGDADVNASKFQDAIENFKGAINLKVGDKVATSKLANAEKLLADEASGKAKLEEEFSRLLASGDANVTGQKFTEAILNFKSALELKPRNAVATDKLTNAEKLLAKANADKAKLDEEFARLLASGDQNVGKLKYNEAIGNFKEALTIRAGDKIALEKLAGAEQLLARANADKVKLESEFIKLLASGDANVNGQKYPEAIENFKSALVLKPENQIATEKLKNAEKLYAQLNADKAKMEEEFTRLLASGDANVVGQKYPEAIDNFKGALALKTGDKIATAKMANAEQLLAKVNADKAKLEAEFARLLAVGDANVTGLKYPEAITNFKDALKVKPNNEVALSKLSNVEQLLAKVNADMAKLEEEFARLLASGDLNVESQKYPEAIDNFKGALVLKAGDKVATVKLANAEQLLAKVNADKAKLEAEFTRLLAAGDANVTGMKYPEAITNFKDALKVKPNNEVAMSKLSNVEQLLAKVNADKAKLEEDFSRLLAIGDLNITGQKYSEAIDNFKGALLLKAGDKVATTKLANAEQLLAKVNADKAKMEAEFTRLLAAGDANVTGLKYPEAIANFKDALKVKPNDPVAASKLSATEKLLTLFLAEKQRKEAEQKILADKQKKYNETIAKADQLFAGKSLTDAKDQYREAIRIFELEKYPKDRIVAIDSILAQQAKDKIAAQKLAEQQQKLQGEGSYLKNIQTADANFAKSCRR